MTATEARVLLLTCPLGQEVQPLKPAEYLPLLSAPEERLAAFGGSRAEALLCRRPALDAYLAAAPEVQVVTCLSPAYPGRLGRLGKNCPPALFCKGDLSLFATPCISLVGARQLLPRGRAFARRIGRLAAKEGLTLVSGGAAGADTVAQDACLEAGGRVIVFLPDELQHHEARHGQLLCSTEGYDLPFSASRALERNHFIHALGAMTFVAQCDKPAGGTWAGTRHNLAHGLSPVFLPNDGSAGAAALRALGARVVEDDLTTLRFPAASQLSIFD